MRPKCRTDEMFHVERFDGYIVALGVGNEMVYGIDGGWVQMRMLGDNGLTEC